MTQSALRLSTQLAPNGRLRAAINLGNPVLAHIGSSGALAGVTVELAHALSEALDIGLDLVPYESAGAVVRALEEDKWDVAFIANEPERAKDIQFAKPYVSIEGTYMTCSDWILDLVQIDQAGVSIAVGDGAAYHLILKRLLKNASLVTSQTSAQAIEFFAAGRSTAVAGIRQTLLADRKSVV